MNINLIYLYICGGAVFLSGLVIFMLQQDWTYLSFALVCTFFVSSQIYKLRNGETKESIN